MTSGPARGCLPVGVTVIRRKPVLVMPIRIFRTRTNPSSDPVLMRAELPRRFLATVVWRYAANRAGSAEICRFAYY
jgi:hypothetical protein